MSSLNTAFGAQLRGKINTQHLPLVGISSKSSQGLMRKMSLHQQMSYNIWYVFYVLSDLSKSNLMNKLLRLLILIQ